MRNATLFYAVPLTLAMVTSGCDNSGSKPLPFPKDYVPKNPPIEKHEAKPAPEPLPLGIGDKVIVSAGVWGNNVAHGVILSAPSVIDGSVTVLFIDSKGACYRLVVPVSILLRQ